MHRDRTGASAGERLSRAWRLPSGGDSSPRASREPRVGRALCCVTARRGGWDAAETPPRLGWGTCGGVGGRERGAGGGRDARADPAP